MLDSLAFDAGAFDNAAFLFEEISVSLSEAAEASESSTSSSTSGGASITEASVAADALTAQADLIASISEAAAPGEQSVGGGVSTASIEEAAPASDSAISTAGIPASTTETASAADDSQGIPEAGSVAVTEAVTAGDTINLIAAFGVSIDEAVIAAESSVSGGTTTGDRMPYTTRVQLDNTFGVSEISSLLDRDNDGGEDVGVLAYAIANADALIDGYLSSRYEVPLLEIPQLIAQMSADIVRFLLWEDKAPAEVQKRYDERIKQLQQIQQGYISLPSSVPASTTAAGGVGYVETDPVFTMDSLSEF